MEWRTAFFAQAQSDYGMFRELNRGDVPMSHKLHYLQMATEKLAKAFMSPPTGDSPPKVHNILVKFLQISKGRPEIRRKLGYESNPLAYSSYINSLIGVAGQIEGLAPTAADERPNPEYPWANAAGDVQCPAHYHFPEINWQEIVAFQHLTAGLFRIFPECGVVGQ